MNVIAELVAASQSTLVVRVAARLCGQDAADVVQSALVSAIEATYQGDYDGENPQAYLLTLVRNAHFKALRKARHSSAPRLARVVKTDDGDDKVEQLPEGVWFATQDTERLFSELCELAELDDREIQLLYWMAAEGYSLREIEAREGIPLGTLARRSSELKAKIRAIL